MSEPQEPQTEQSVNSLAFINRNDGAAIEYEGPFAFIRDGGAAEVVIPTDPDDYAGIHGETAKNLTDRTDDIAVAIADASVECSGIIEAVEIVDGKLVVRINDGSYANHRDIDIDWEALDQ